MVTKFRFKIGFALLIAISANIFLYVLVSSSTEPLPSKKALFYEKLPQNKIKCSLCPRRCEIAEGKRGFCGVRENQKGELYALSFAKPVTLNIFDPIEKKPLFHFLPGRLTFSIATAGCNLKCKFCQNWQISQAKPEDIESICLTPRELIDKVKAAQRSIIAYTYNEPTIFYEYMLETAKLAKSEGIANVMHSNGFINELPLKELAKYLDAANIDLKAFNNNYYEKTCSGTLEPVLKSLKILKEAGVHLEITALILPGLNDNPDELKQMCEWIKQNLGPETPLHFSRFYPTYKLDMLSPTPIDSLKGARLIALDTGLKYVYIGNVSVPDAENTICPNCKKVLVVRSGYTIQKNEIKNGKCPFCGEKIYGKWQ